MLAKIFNNNKPLTWALLFLLSLGSGFWVLSQRPTTDSVFYFAGFTTPISDASHWILWPIGLGITTLIFNILITERLELIKRSSYLGLAFTLLMGFSGDVSLSTLAAAFTFMFAAYQLVYSGPFEKISGQLFNIGFFMGLAASFEPLLSWMIIPSIIVLIIFGRAQFRYITLLILGIVTPWIALAEIYYLTDNWEAYTFFVNELFPISHLGFYWSDDITLVGAALYGLCILFAAKEYTVAIAKAKIYKKQGYNTFWIFLIALVTLSLLNPDKASTALFIAQIPLSILFTNFLQYLRKKWMLELALWALIALNLLTPYLAEL
ncbi:MAG: hypothetical protein SchgKO_03730 [Schleiferiaceae bacterium]